MTCRHADPLRGLPYVGAAYRAEKLCADGWKQKKCAACGLWMIWIKPTKLEKLLAQEKRLRKEHRRVGILKIKLEVKLARLREKIWGESVGSR